MLEGIRGQKSVAEICREHQISQTLFYRWRDRFLESGQKGLTAGGARDESEVLRAEIEKLEKIIGRQTIAIKATINPRVDLREAVKLMQEKVESLKSACETLRTSRSGQYRRPEKKAISAMHQVLVEKLKEVRLGHPFWGYRRMTAWPKYREALAVNRNRIHRLMRENGLPVEQVRYKTLRIAQRPKPKATRPNQYCGINMTKFLLGPLG